MIFPNLARERLQVYGLALLAITALLLLVGLLRLSGATVAIASAAIPLLYGIYVYEIWVDDLEPLRTLGITAAISAVLGAAFALLTGHYVAQTLLLNAFPPGAPLSRIVVSAAVIPLGAQLVMLAAPLMMRTRPGDDVRDGFDLGAGSALGFVFASTLVYLSPELQSGSFVITASIPFALRAVVHGLIVPLIYAGTTGLVVSSFWLYRRPLRVVPRYIHVTDRATSLAVAAVVQVALGLTDIFVQTSVTAIVIYVVVGIALFYWVRLALPTMLLAETGERPRDLR